jgi:hypothetical protein
MGLEPFVVPHLRRSDLPLFREARADARAYFMTPLRGCEARADA